LTRDERRNGSLASQIKRFILILQSLTNILQAIVNSNNINLHSYTLWRNDGERNDDVVFTMGKHGEMNASPAHDRGDNLADIISHNLEEMKKAMEEEEKWEMRMKESPLGKTQQDFVAYYTELIKIFEEWCIANGIQPPHNRTT
jgi:hypothetical protein